jgi:carboxyl-terminal processing protease
MKHGELENADSINFADTVIFKTPAGKIVHGGGGIMPDVFVPLDTTAISEYFATISNLESSTSLPNDYVDKNRSGFNKYKDF